MILLTADGPELKLEAAHLLDVVRQVLHEDLQLGSLFLVPLVPCLCLLVDGVLGEVTFIGFLLDV